MSYYQGRHVFSVRPDFTRLRGRPLDDVVWSGRGPSIPWRASEAPRRMVQLPFILEDRAAIRSMRCAWQEFHGRLLGFWLPVWIGDYWLREDAAATASTIRIANVGLASAVSFSQFRHLAFLSGHGDTIVPAEIASVATDGDDEVITLAEPLSAAVSAETTNVCALIFARFASDDLQLRYESETFARCSVRFIELPAEYSIAHQGSSPVWLYKFTRGETVWRFAGWGADIVVGGETWTASAITHEEIKSSVDFLPGGTRLEAVTDDAAHPLRYYLQGAIFETTDVEIYRVDAFAPELGAAVFSGRVGEVRFAEHGRIAATVDDVFRGHNAEVPRILYQRTDNLTPFGPNGGKGAAGFTTVGTLTAVGSRYVEAAEFAAVATAEGDPDWFRLGSVRVGNQVRLCTHQDGARLYLHAGFSDVSAGAEASAIPGYDRRMETAVDKFDNLARFLGFPHMPAEHPAIPARAIKTSTGKKG